MKTIPLILATLLLAGSTAFAGSVTIDDSIGAAEGGEFLATVVDGFAGNTPGTVFATFGLEKNEYLAPGTGEVFDVGVNTAADEGGRGGPSPDPIDPMTAYLYSGFRAGTLQDSSGHLYGTGGAAQHYADANDLQAAIWYIEQEIRNPDPSSWFHTGDLAVFAPGAGAARFATVAYDAVYGQAPTWSGLGGVIVMNLTDAAGSRKMDMLALDPPSDLQGETVPLPAGLAPGLLLLLGLGLVRSFSRRADRRRAI